MKTVIILLLLVAIVGLTHFTRPSERSFQSAVVSASVDNELLFKDVVYKDRFLWVDVQKDGRTLYTGAFGHWFEHGKVLEAPAEKAGVKLPV